MKPIKRIAVYCSSSEALVDPLWNDIRDFAKTLVRLRWDLIYGGASVGVMGLLADEVLSFGGAVYGVIPEMVLGREVAHSKLTELIKVKSMHERKEVMAQMADGFLIFPGGFGTLDECIEMLTWRQLGLHDKPIVFFNPNDYWNPLFSFFEKMVEAGTARLEDLSLYRVAPSVTDIFEEFEKF